MLSARPIFHSSGFMSFAVASFLAFAAPAAAQDALFERIMEHQRIDQWFETLGDDVAGLARPEDGFSASQIEAWERSAQTAFDRAAMAADFTEAMRDGLSDEVMQAALDFEDSATNQAYVAVRDEVDALPPEDVMPFVEKSRDQLEGDSNEIQALYVSLFKAQGGPDQAENVVEGLYRIMTTLASPIHGDDIAQQWIELSQSEGMLETYVEEYFLLSTGVYRQISQPQVEEILEAVSSPLGAQYHLVLGNSFDHAYGAAIDRLETEFATELGR